MRGMNRIVIIGRLGADPELRTAKSGNPWATLSVATNRARKEGDTWIEETDWHEVKVFGEDAERCHRRLKRGSVVAVDGSLVYEAWTDDQGARRRKPKIVASRVQFVSDLRPADARDAGRDDAPEPTLDVAPL